MDDLKNLNKELLKDNAELVKQLKRVKAERDNFEQLVSEWKKINNNASEALNLLQKEKKKYMEENASLNEQIKEFRQEVKALKMQNRERMEQCDHLLLRCAQYQNDVNNLKNESESQMAHNVNNKLKFNYQQKKNEMDEMLYHIQKLFAFCNDKYPQMMNAPNHKKLLNGIEEGGDENNGKRKRRSLSFISRKKKLAQGKDEVVTMKKRRNKSKENIDSKISAQLLGPSKQPSSDPFVRTQSSHSFFNEQGYRYNQVQINMNKLSTKLWSKRDSLGRKKKAVRINAIPSSAGGTPLTTPHQSHRGKLSDDEEQDTIYDEDPHQKYLQMMDVKDGTSTTTQQQIQTQPQPQPQPQSSSSRNKLTDKKTIHDLFDMLQQQTLSPSSPNSTSNSHDNDIRNAFGDEQQSQNHQNSSDAQLVPLCDSSTDSDSSSSD